MNYFKFSLLLLILGVGWQWPPGRRSGSGLWVKNRSMSSSASFPLAEVPVAPAAAYADPILLLCPAEAVVTFPCHVSHLE